MENLKERLEELMNAGNWSTEDRDWLLNYLDKNDSSILQQIMQQQFSSNIETGKSIKTTDARRLLELIRQKINPASTQPKVVRFSYRKWVAAAAIILSVSATYFLFINNPQKVIADIKIIQTKPAEILPGGNKATLTLADGTTIILDSAKNGELSQQGGTKVLKLDNGQLAYNKAGNAAEVVYNIVTTPRGGQYQLTLADGTKVWLNAASSLRFPASFSGAERRVQLNGEGYFEVAKNAAMPFKVEMAGKGEVEVLGTHFNINAYSDEVSINTTLLEGSVKVTGLSTNDSRLLTPGQQAQQSSTGQIAVKKNTDIEEVMAWKNGKFVFGTAADISVVMRQVARWYNVDVVYEGAVPKQRFGGELLRNSSLVQVLEILKTSGVNYLIDGRKLIIRQ